MWIWQQENWTNFIWDKAKISPKLRQLHLKQGVLLGKMQGTPDEQQTTLDTLLANILYSSAIEGEQLSAFSVRSSLAKRMKLNEETPFPTTKQTDGFAEIMLDAVENYSQPLSLNRLLRWHTRLFPQNEHLFRTIVGGELRDNTVMQVVSGRIDKPKVHFQAPDRKVLEAELTAFIDWFNHSLQDPELDPLLRAAIAHLWFVTLHPFADGNGRITRLLTDLALTQAENQSIRFYAMSATIATHKNAYYKMLETTQRGTSDITAWLVWFLTILEESINDALVKIEQTVFKTHFWQRVNQTQLNEGQIKVLNRLLDGDFPNGINANQYCKVTKVSSATATRHLKILVDMQCLQKSPAGGRSTRYLLLNPNTLSRQVTL